MDVSIRKKLKAGCVIPAHPLALRFGGKIDERYQKALTRYYLAAGAGGLAVGVHTTQFAIHKPEAGLYRPVLELASETARECTESSGRNAPVMIAGITGDTSRAVEEAGIASELGYHAGLISVAALRGTPVAGIVKHCREVAEVIPVVGFYLQECISNMPLPGEFWRRFVEIPNVVAIKIAPFNRYQTLDVLEAVAYAGRHTDIALYTGNDDNIIADFLTPYEFNFKGRKVSFHIAGGLLGQWACWTKRAVEYLSEIKEIRWNELPVPRHMLALSAQLTLANRAIFDAANGFSGCIPGISYVLKSQGLMREAVTLDPEERMSKGQAAAIDQVMRDYPHLTDNHFVRNNLQSWLK